MFLDQATIEIQSGKGGDGCVSFRREKYVPFGGPNGGDGGRGGHVYVQANKNLMTLLDIHCKYHYKAGNGKSGAGNNRHGKDGIDLVLQLPIGTQIFNAETKELLIDLVEDKQKVLILYGGKGGRGNQHFATPTKQTPQYAELGQESDRKILNLELKMIADVGLIGYPNVGKSTLLSKISRAHPKIANYPFTTLYPNLGVVYLDEFKSFVVADIPGIIEGAYQGIGLGDKFLRHIERTKLLVHILEPAPDAIDKFHILNKEMSLYNQKLTDLPQIVIVNKMDIPEANEEFIRIKDELSKLNIEPVGISALTGQGIKELIRLIVM